MSSKSIIEYQAAGRGSVNNLLSECIYSWVDGWMDRHSEYVLRVINNCRVSDREWQKLVYIFLLSDHIINFLSIRKAFSIYVPEVSSYVL